jgi:hypothetical protein
MVIDLNLVVDRNYLQNKKQRSNKNNMATTTVPPQDVKAGHFNTETWDVAYGFPLDANGKREDPNVLSPETAEKQSEANKFEGSSITVRCTYPATFSGLMELANSPVTDEDGKPVEQKDVQAELVRIFNAGAKVKVNSRLRARLTKQVQEGEDKGELVFNEATDLGDDKVLDLTSEITSGSKRIFLSEELKTWRSLANLPKEIRENMWKVYLTSTGKDFYIPAE